MIVGKAGQQLIESVDHYIAFILLLLIGGNMLIEAIKDRIKEYKGEEVQKRTIKPPHQQRHFCLWLLLQV